MAPSTPMEPLVLCSRLPAPMVTAAPDSRSIVPEPVMTETGPAASETPVAPSRLRLPAAVPLLVTLALMASVPAFDCSSTLPPLLASTEASTPRLPAVACTTTLPPPLTWTPACAASVTVDVAPFAPTWLIVTATLPSESAWLSSR